MSTRRKFIMHSAAAGVLAAAATQFAPTRAASQPRIKRVIRREETVLRLGGFGDNYHMSWAADDRQYVSVCDGAGWIEKPKRVYNSRLWAITGGPQDAAFQDVPGYPDKIYRKDDSLYYNFGTLALDGRIYQFLSAPDQPSTRPDGSVPDRGWLGAKLIYSADNGMTWRNQDGSTPVVWEPVHLRSRQNMVFFEEPQNAFSLLSILQMGRNYEANRDGYVYVYAPNGNTDGTMNELVMFRVPKAHILNRRAYEYFAHLLADGSARWVKEINARGVVHGFPGGWVGKSHYAWHPSVTYNAPLDLYMMANWGMGCSADGDGFGKPSYLGFWTAPHPWGPWTQIHEETVWMPANDPAARAYQPQIAPKWIAADGKSFWLVWTDFQGEKELDKSWKENHLAKEWAQLSDDEFAKAIAMAREYTPYYSFNTQRVDLILA